MSTFRIQRRNGLSGRIYQVDFDVFKNGQNWPKLAKHSKNGLFFADLSILSINFSLRLPKNQFASHSDQKKLIFGKVENFLDFTVEKWPNPKSVPFCPDLAKKIWSNGLSISQKLFSSDFEVFWVFCQKLYQKSEKNKPHPLLNTVRVSTTFYIR